MSELFIQNNSDMAKPLTDLTREGEKNTVNWGPSQEAFCTLKDKLASAPILQAPDHTKDFVLRTDASNTSLGAILLQAGDDNLLHPVAYASRNILPRETRYSTTLGRAKVSSVPLWQEIII